MLDGFFVHIQSFVIPLLFANLLHMVCIKLNVLPILARPISMRWFGYGKTFRGFILLTIFTGFFAWGVAQFNASSPSDQLVIGMILGFVYALGELPNSYIKRRLEIGSGKQGTRKYLQLVIDKLDSLIFLMPVYYVISSISMVHSIILFIGSFVLHVFVSYLVWKLGLKKNL